MSVDRITHHTAVFFTYDIVDAGAVVLERIDMSVGYVHGAGSELIEKLEAALEGARVGDHVEVTVDPGDGFGEPDPTLMFTDKLENVPAEYRYVGAEAQFENEHGDTRTLVVTDIEDGKLTVDGNHPFAGKVLTYRVSIQSIRDATPAEIHSGKPDEFTSAAH